MVSSNLTDNAITILKGRYLVKDQKTGEVSETPSDMFRRVAKAIANSEVSDVNKAKYEEIYYEMLWDLDFVPNSPTLMNAGTGAGTLSACYVLPIPDSMDGIMTAAYDQAMVEKYGGGVGFPLSNLRPEGTPIKTTQGQACGPINVLKTLSQVGTMITQGGKRDGAHMAIMSVYHPDIEKFITCKTTEGEIHNFNISVGADSTFMNAVKDDQYLHLTWPLDKNSYSEKINDDGKWIKARDIWSKISAGAWKNGEPGMVWLDRINQDNATPHIGDIEATNPCGEQPLLGNESCNLGSINLANFVIHSPSSGTSKFDSVRFKETVANCVRFLDSVVDANSHPTEATTAMNNRTRKIGLGIMGWADLLFQLEMVYDSEEALKFAGRVGKMLQDTADKASEALGKELGSFPEFDQSPLNKKNGGKWAAMRNAWRLSIAPTGTIAMIADTSSSIEPQFALAYTKQNLSTAYANKQFIYTNKYFLGAMAVWTKLSGDEQQEIIEALNRGESLQDMSYDVEGFDRLKKIFVVANDIPHINHVKVQAAFQKYVDSGISKTINLPNETTQEEIAEAYQLAWELDCKGITVYRDGSRDKEVLKAGTSNESDSSKFLSQSTEEWVRPHEMTGATSKIQTGHGSFYVTVNKDGNHLIKEVVAWTGKSGACEHASTEAIGRLISTAIQFGVPMPVLVKQLRGIECCPKFWNGKRNTSPVDAIAQILDDVAPSSVATVEPEITIEQPKQEIATAADSAIIGNKQPCQECETPMISQGNCDICPSCGWSKCG